MTHAATSKVENSAQGSSCKLKFVHSLADRGFNNKQKMTGVLFPVLAGMALLLINNIIIIIYNNITN